MDIHKVNLWCTNLDAMSRTLRHPSCNFAGFSNIELADTLMESRKIIYELLKENEKLKKGDHKNVW